MKNKLLTLLLVLFFVPVFAQNNSYTYSGRSTPSVKKEKLKQAKFIYEIMPELWRTIELPHADRVELDSRRTIDSYKEWYNYVYPQEYNYNKLINYILVEITTICNGKQFTSQSINDKLTTEQKNILNAADLGTNIFVKIKYNYKYTLTSTDNKVIEGKLLFTVIPETEAEFSGGFKQLTAYLIENIFNRFPDKNSSLKIQQAIVSFTVNEEGKIINVKLFRTSTDPKMDKLIIDAITKMPTWKPAKDTKHIYVKQEFTIPFSNGGC